MHGHAPINGVKWQPFSRWQGARFRRTGEGDNPRESPVPRPHQGLFESLQAEWGRNPPRAVLDSARLIPLNLAAYLRSIAQFGTHLVRSVDVGGRAAATSTVRKETMSESEGWEAAVSLKAKVSPSTKHSIKPGINYLHEFNKLGWTMPSTHSEGPLTTASFTALGAS